MRKLFVVLLIAAAAPGCAALVPLASLLLPGGSSVEVHTQTEVKLDEGNFVVTKPNVIGVSEGFKLLGFITLVPARLTAAMTELYEQAPTNEGRPQTIVHLTTEQSEPWFILFSLPKWTARADFVEFVPAPTIASSVAEKKAAPTTRR
jgi:hypothetical protein